MSSGLTSSSTAAWAFAENFSTGFALDLGGWAVTMIGLGFVGVITLINICGVSESVWVNAVFTCIELTGLIIIVVIGMMVFGAGVADIGKAFEFGESGDGIFWPVISGTTLAFFAMVGFDVSVNMAEETDEPSRIFPKMLFAGLGIAALLYLVVSFVAISIVPVDELADGDTPPLKVVEAGAPGFPPWIFGLITMIAVGNSALINLKSTGQFCIPRQRNCVCRKDGCCFPFEISCCFDQRPWPFVRLAALPPGRDPDLRERRKQR